MADCTGIDDTLLNNQAQKLAHAIRLDSLRMTSSGGSSHIGACLSVADILAVLYSSVIRHQPHDPKWAGRDRVILSKGHAGAALYAALAHSGYFEPALLKNHYQNGSIFSGHVSHKGVPGVEISTGSLGHGLSIGAGFAYSQKLENSAQRTFVVLSDGECDEGSIWEAVLFAAHHSLAGLRAIIDYNKIQSLGNVEDVLQLEPFTDKWRAFGWNVLEVDGHDHQMLRKGFSDADLSKDKPTCLICHTIKGKGISFMENQLLWHYRTARGDELTAAMAELLAQEFHI